jgi:plastocyanin
MQKLRLLMLGAAYLAMASCGGGGGSSGGSPTGTTGGDNGGTTTGIGPNGGACQANMVCFRSDTYSPTAITVARGATVTFYNGSGVEHTVNFTSNSPSGGDITSISSGSVTRTFNTSGVANFYCNIHGSPTSGMRGSITVQ